MLLILVYNINTKLKRRHNMAKYICNTCGYVYDEDLGDAEHGIQAGTRFEDIPDEWVCPLCSMGKDDFSKE